MDATSAIAIAGLTTALLGTLTVPLLQSFFTGRREKRTRAEERQHAAYVDAITYAQVLEARLNDLTEDPMTRSGRELPAPPDRLLIQARLQLVAPSGTVRAFEALGDAWDILAWNLREDGVRDSDGELIVREDDKDVLRALEALKDLKSTMRPKELGAITT